MRKAGSAGEGSGPRTEIRAEGVHRVSAQGHSYSEKGRAHVGAPPVGLPGRSAQAWELKGGRGPCATPTLEGRDAEDTRQEERPRKPGGRARRRAWPRPQGRGTRARTCPRANVRAESGSGSGTRTSAARLPGSGGSTARGTGRLDHAGHAPRPTGRSACAGEAPPTIQAPPFPRGARGGGGAGAGGRGGVTWVNRRTWSRGRARREGGAGLGLAEEAAGCTARPAPAPQARGERLGGGGRERTPCAPRSLSPLFCVSHP